ncbi:MAG: ABC transporter substrate-binding protein [Burkholderiales bacterium]|nr:ABC transporter substrate-binding protein [Burkholderiales bacterium]
MHHAARRKLLIAAGAVLAPPVVWAQPGKGRTARIAILHSAPVFRASLVKRLAELGYVDGKNVQVDVQVDTQLPNPLARVPAAAAEAVRRGVDVIVAGGGEALVKAVREGAPATPLVMIFVDFDPVATGVVKSLARPGGNTTGVYSQTIILAGKRLELLKEAIPATRRVAVLFEAATRGQLEGAQQAAGAAKVILLPQEMRGSAYDLRGTLREAVKQGADSVLVLSWAELYAHRADLARALIELRLPSSGNTVFARSGILLGYGPNFEAMWAQAASHVARILRGQKAGELPIEQVDSFERIVNLATARELGIAIPDTVQRTADLIR